jgi:ATP:ADP antiporter, AAA family
VSSSTVSPAPGPRSASRPEWLALLAAAAACFCLMCGYYTLRPLREAMALVVGREFNDVQFTIVFVCSLAILPLYWWVVARTPRGRLPWLVYLPFALLFAGLAVGLTRYPGDRTVAAVYFVALSVTNLFVISVFWSSMADVWRPALAKRFYGLMAAGGSAGAIVGPSLVRTTVHELGPAPLIVGACVLLLGSAALVSVARRQLRQASGEQVPDAAVPVGGRALDDLGRLVRTPYLLGIAGILVVGQLIGGFMYNEQAKYVQYAYSSFADRTALFAQMELWVNVLALLFQAVVVTLLSWRNSLVASLSALPVLLGASFLVMAVFPVGAVLLVTQVLRRAGDYGLGKPTREMLFTVLNPESKFKSKSLIDTVLQRGADAAAQWLYNPIAVLGLAGISWICGGLCLAMLGVTTYLGRAFERGRGGTEGGRNEAVAQSG